MTDFETKWMRNKNTKYKKRYESRDNTKYKKIKTKKNGVNVNIYHMRLCNICIYKEKWRK